MYDYVPQAFDSFPFPCRKEFDTGDCLWNLVVGVVWNRDIASHTPSKCVTGMVGWGPICSKCHRPDGRDSMEWGPTKSHPLEVSQAWWEE